MTFKKASVVVAILLLMSVFYYAFTILPGTVRGTTLYVGGIGPGNFTTIQSAIDAANPGDVVYVYSGTYAELVIVNKTLSLVGEDRATTMVDGGETPVTLNVTADWVNVTDLTVMGGAAGDHDAGLKLYHAQNCTVENVTASPNKENGIYLYDSHHNLITNSNTSDSYYGNGIVLWYSNNNRILENNVSKKNGVNLFFSSNNMISDNVALESHTGIGLHYNSDGNIVENNTVSSVSWYGGIYVHESNRSSISNNTIYARNGMGILLQRSTHSILANNTMTQSGVSISGDSITHWNSHAIDDSNTANGKPIRYWRNVAGGFVPANAGQVILANCTSVLVENQNVSNTYAGIQLGFSSYNRVTNTTASFSSSGVGFNLMFSDYNALDNNTVSHNYGVGVSMTDSNNNTVENSILDFNGEGFSIRPAHGNVIAGNRLKSNGWAFIIGEGENNTFERNNVTGTGEGFNIFESSNNRILGNTISVGGRAVSIHGYSVGHMIADNNIRNGEDGVTTIGISGKSYGNTITRNVIINTSRAMMIDDSGMDTITLNNISDSDHAIWISGNCQSFSNLTSCTSEVSHNFLFNNSHGISAQFSFNVNVTDNTVVYNGYGIGVGGVGSLVLRNTVMDCMYGIGIGGSDNMVYHNNIINNSWQGLEASDENQWDNGYPSGGNYWSDYTGVDLMWGPNQDRLGSDGIGDTSHYFPDYIDRYPLLYPYGFVCFGRPTILDATLTGKDLENVTLAWSLSSDDGGGLASVVGYEIYRSTSYNITGLDYQSIAALPNGSYEFVDALAGEGDPNNYFYIVCALNLTGVLACSRNQAGKFTRPLLKGPNLVSIPLAQSNDSVGAVFQTVEWDKIWTYNSSTGKWKWHMNFKPYRGELSRVAITEGIWTNVTENSNFTVAGLVPLSTMINLLAGWNLIGFPSYESNYTVAELGAETGGAHVEGFDPSNPPYFLRKLADSDVLQTGFGYWVNVSDDFVWTVGN